MGAIPNFDAAMEARMLPWSEAKDYLRQGMAVRRAKWPHTERIKMINGKLRILRSASETGHGYFYPSERDTSATDWMLYE